MRIADYLFFRLAELGVKQAFCVTGGAAMHLNDALGENGKIVVCYMHHEQSCAMAAEAYFRVSGKPAIVSVTAGPGFLNSLNGIAGAFTDSIPVIVVAGQVKVETIASDFDGLRQLGDQEVKTLQLSKPVSKLAIRVTEKDFRGQIDEAFRVALSDRPGPVILEVPLDVQAAEVPAAGDGTEILNFFPEHRPPLEFDQADFIVDRLQEAERPLVLAGTGVSISGTQSHLRDFCRATNTPVATAWCHDIVESDFELFAGRSGTIGTRPGNFALQAADFLLVLGSRLNVRQTGYNFEQFAPDATICWIDIDDSELSKGLIQCEHRFSADLRKALPAIVEAAKKREWKPNAGWLEWISWLRKLEPQESDYGKSSRGINAYHFVMELDELLRPSTVVACGDATACIVPFQVMSIRDNRRLFSNSGIASMGFDLPAAIGAASASEKPVVCLAGDGSIMMNLQELQTLSSMNADILLIILENDGYLSIRQTQDNFFGRSHGSGPSSGLSFPNFESVLLGFGIPTEALRVDRDWQSSLSAAINKHGVRAIVVHLDSAQEFEPRLKSRQTADGIVSPPLDEMYPFFPEKVTQAIRDAARGKASLNLLDELITFEQI